MKAPRNASWLSSSLAFGLALSSCGNRSESASESFVRCASRDAPAPRQVPAGASRLTVDGRTVTWQRTTGPVRVAFFRGRAPFASSLRAGLSCLSAHDLSGVVVLGDFGDRPSHVRDFVASLASSNLPVGLLPGGRDRVLWLDDALGALDDSARARLVDLSAVRRIEIGARVIFPVAGADASSRAGGGVCGYDDGDIAKLLDGVDLNIPDGALLASWLAPSTEGLGIANGAAGSEAVRRYATRLGVRGAVSVWPPHHAGTLVSDVFVAANLAGGKASRANGEFAPRGFVMVAESGPPEFVECP